MVASLMGAFVLALGTVALILTVERAVKGSASESRAK
jgi:hypothetical protein